MQAVPLGELLDLPPRFLFLQEAALRRFGAQNDVVQHGEYLHQLEVLVDHADTQCRGIVGIVDLHRLAVLAYLARLTARSSAWICRRRFRPAARGSLPFSVGG